MIRNLDHSKRQKSIEEIKRGEIKRANADGLYNPDVGGDPCGCGLNDMAPCGHISLECMVGYLHGDMYYSEPQSPLKGTSERSP